MDGAGSLRGHMAGDAAGKGELLEQLAHAVAVGVVDVGEFHFGTDAPERMSVLAGELWARLPGEEAFRAFPAGTAFEVPAKSGFDVKASAPAAYLCEFL